LDLILFALVYSGIFSRNWRAAWNFCRSRQKKNPFGSPYTNFWPFLAFLALFNIKDILFIGKILIFLCRFVVPTIFLWFWVEPSESPMQYCEDTFFSSASIFILFWFFLFYFSIINELFISWVKNYTKCCIFSSNSCIKWFVV
jgi:hypothetical protein